LVDLIGTKELWWSGYVETVQIRLVLELNVYDDNIQQ